MSAFLLSGIELIFFPFKVDILGAIFEGDVSSYVSLVSNFLRKLFLRLLD